MAENKHATISQVAERAGVSIQTVSRVLNNRPDVSLETRHRVQQVIDELDYQPYAIARGLASKRMYTLGLIASDFTDYWFAKVADSAEKEVRTHGYFFMLGSKECDLQDEPKYLRLLTERHVEGILFIRASHPDEMEILRNITQSGVPVVTTGIYLPGSDFSFIEVDNVDGGRKATQYLIGLGHTQIAMITGPSELLAAQSRMQGYQQALESAGIPLDPRLIVHGEAWLHRSGYNAMKELLGRNHPFTAVFAQNDRLAKGAVSALNEAGLKVPQDVSIIGFDDLPEAEFDDPPLTTMHQPMDEVGKAAASLLIKLIEDPYTTPQQLLFNTELVIRSSCASLRK